MEILNKQKIFQTIEEISKNNLISKEKVKEIIKECIFKTFYLKFDNDAKLELIMNEENNIFQLFNHSKIIIEDEDFKENGNPFIEISLSNAKKINKDSKVDDIIKEKINFQDFQKNISSTLKQLMIQRLREMKKESIYKKYKDLKNKTIDATVLSSTKSYVILELENGVTAFMPSKLRNLNIPLKIGQKTKVYVEDVLKESKDSQILVSNGSPKIILNILKKEIPEFDEGIIEIVDIARSPGERTKIVVKSNKEEVDPVGSIIGANGSRINSIISKLENEKIDIILWDEDKNKLIVNALSPSKVISVIDKKNENNEKIDNYKIAIVPNKHQTLAIGKRGNNAKLVVKLAECKIDILSIDEAKEKGINIVWNGNIEDEQELNNIENGIKTFRKNKFNNYSNKNQFNYKKNNVNKDFDIDISSFSEKINMEESNEKNDIELEDSIFSEEELKQMEQNFEMDEDLPIFEEDFLEEDE